MDPQTPTTPSPEAGIAKPRVTLVSLPPVKGVFRFRAAATFDRRAPIVEYRWQFGDGTTRTAGRLVAHRFVGESAQRVVKVVAIDTLGRAAATSVVIRPKLAVAKVIESGALRLRRNGSMLLTLRNDGPVTLRAITLRIVATGPGRLRVSYASLRSLTVRPGTEMTLALTLTGVRSGRVTLSVRATTAGTAATVIRSMRVLA